MSHFELILLVSGNVDKNLSDKEEGTIEGKKGKQKSYT